MKIFCIGMNYAAHNKELHGTLKKPDEPVIFLKADSSLLKDHKPFFIPDHLGRIEYETEVVVRICKLGKTVPVRFAPRYYDALTVGIDFTARELQHKLSAAGQPWDLAKGFDGAACLGEWVPKEKFRDLNALRFHLDINGQTVQEGCTRSTRSSHISASISPSRRATSSSQVRPPVWDPYISTTTWKGISKRER